MSAKTGYEHYAHPKLASGRVRILVAGAGGTGSQMLTGLGRLNAGMRALGHPGLDVIAYDPDEVSVANLGRQLFAHCDIGHNKAEVLITRLNVWFGTAWEAVPLKFTPGRTPWYEGATIAITCVDTAAARVSIGKALSEMPRVPVYWLDLGNRASDGQVVLGVPPRDKEHALYEFRLPTVLELFPEIATEGKRLDRDNGPSCSLAQALERQRMFVNQAVCIPAFELLEQIFRNGRIHWHGQFVNLATGRSVPIPVDPEVWRRMGHHAELACPDLDKAAMDGASALCVPRPKKPAEARDAV